MAGQVTNDGSNTEGVTLKGTPANPARSPKVMTSADKNSLGWIACNDAILIIIGAWVIVGLTYFSLRHWNV